MKYIYIIIVVLVLQLLLMTTIEGNTNRRHRHRRQTSGSLYGTNANLGSSAPAGFNHPANINYQGTRLNNPDARDLYLNPMISSSNGANSIHSVNLYGLPREQVEQVFGSYDQTSVNRLYDGSAFVPGYVGSRPLFPSNNQMAYPANPNQVLSNKDLQGSPLNINNNRFSYDRQQSPNRNTYFGSMDAYPNRNSWSNTNNNQRYSPNSVNSWSSNRNNPYPISNRDGNSFAYGSAYQSKISYFILIFSTFATILRHL